MDHSDFNYNLSTQEHQKIIPKNYLQRQLIPSGNLKDDGLPAPVQNSSLLPQDALLCVYPPNATRQSYFQGAERAYLHSSPEFKRDLSYLKQRWVFFQAANRGHVPTLVVRSKKGSKTVKITNWVEFVLYNSKKPMEIISKEAVELFYIFTHKCHQDFPDSDRLFHRPSGKATPSSRFYFEHKVQGEHFILKAVSFYAKKLQEFDADFPDHPKITNGSVRKCHSYILNTSNLPASVQQRSLGHHSSSSNQYWANNYLDPKDKNIRQQVAQTVAGRISNVFPTNSKPLTFPGTPPQVEPRTPSGTKRPLTQSPNHSIPYRSGTIKLDPINSSDEDFSMDLPRGARVVISLPGGIQMKFKITK